MDQRRDEAYLDWNEVEDKWVQAVVDAEAGDNPLGNRRRGMGDIWRRATRDIKEQQAYLARR